MNNSFRTALVYVRNTLAGELKETEEGYSFTYKKAYLEDPFSCAVSLTLPKRTETYKSKTLFAFFDGLIPEGWLLNVVSRNWKVSERDRFGLLLVACQDCIGTVSIRENKI